MAWLQYTARLSQWGGRGYFSSSNDFFISFATPRVGGGVSTLRVPVFLCMSICVIPVKSFELTYMYTRVNNNADLGLVLSWRTTIGYFFLICTCYSAAQRITEKFMIYPTCPPILKGSCHEIDIFFEGL